MMREASRGPVDDRRARAHVVAGDSVAARAMLGPPIDAHSSRLRIGEFGVPQIAVQQTPSVYLFAYAFMMLWHGALADAGAEGVAGQSRDLRTRHAGRGRRAHRDVVVFRALQGPAQARA